MSDYDRETWQAEQAARDDAQVAYRDKMSKARERSAANAKRKISRLHAKLTELGHISDFEDEFGESVLERLDKYGSAYQDREKGRAGDALSIAQRQVVARMNKKVKELKAKQRAGEGAVPDPDAEYERTADRWKTDDGRKSGFKTKRKSSYTPRVRYIDDEVLEDETPPRPINPAPPRLVSAISKAPAKNPEAPYIPKYSPPPRETANVVKAGSSERSSASKRPFLRIVPKVVE